MPPWSSKMLTFAFSLKHILFIALTWHGFHSLIDQHKAQRLVLGYLLNSWPGQDIEATGEGIVNILCKGQWIHCLYSIFFSCPVRAFVLYFSDFMCLRPCSYSPEVAECNLVHQIQQNLLEPTVSRVPFKESEMHQPSRCLRSGQKGSVGKWGILPKSHLAWWPSFSWSSLSRKESPEYISLLEWGSCALVLMTGVSPGEGSLLTLGAVCRGVPCISGHLATLPPGTKC